LAGFITTLLLLFISTLAVEELVIVLGGDEASELKLLFLPSVVLKGEGTKGSGRALKMVAVSPDFNSSWLCSLASSLFPALTVAVASRLPMLAREGPPDRSPTGEAKQ
jgi:hypothetical protein